MQSIEERAAAAYELKATGKCNCSQSVVKVFQDKLPVGEDTLMKLTAGYAAGIACSMPCVTFSGLKKYRLKLLCRN